MTGLFRETTSSSPQRPYSLPIRYGTLPALANFEEAQPPLVTAIACTDYRVYACVSQCNA